MISYAQNFEDVILWRALKRVKNGFYIDVGAYDPTQDSVTKFFYDNGWSGINIDPVTPYYNKFQLERPRDINLNLLISDKEGETAFFENSKTGISSVVEDNIKIWEEQSSFKFEKLNKIAKTLDTVCAENEVNTVHFLKIDVEGSELNVLKGFSLKAVRPWVVLFEAVTSAGEHDDVSADCVSYLRSKKYHQVYFDGLNKFFVADEHNELDSAFLAPLNIFDNSQIHLDNSHWLINSNINILEQACQRKIEAIIFDKQQIIDKAEIELDTTKSQFDLAKVEIESVKKQLVSTNDELTSVKVLANFTKVQLESKVNELITIYNSRGWKVILILHKLVRFFIPLGSRRRKIFGRIWRYSKVPLKLSIKVVKKIKKIIISLFKSSALKVQRIATPPVLEESDNLSPRARKIYFDLREAIDKRNKNK